MMATDFSALRDDGGNLLVTHSSPGLAATAARIHQTVQDALERPRYLYLATGRLVGLLRSLRRDATGVRLAWTESEDGGIRDDRLADLAGQLERAVDALLADAEQADQAAQGPNGDQAGRAALFGMSDQVLTLKLWLGAPLTEGGRR